MTDPTTKQCPTCGGSGTAEWPPDYRGNTTVSCPDCHGTGLATPAAEPLQDNYLLGAVGQISPPADPQPEPILVIRDYAAEKAEIAAIHKRQGHDYQCSWCGAKPDIAAIRRSAIEDFAEKLKEYALYPPELNEGYVPLSVIDAALKEQTK